MAKKNDNDKKEVKKRATFDLPGQKKETPDELNSLRMFHEAAYKEFPDCESSEKWLLQHGLIPKAQAIKLAVKYAPRRSNTTKKKKKTTTTSTKKKKKTTTSTKNKKKTTTSTKKKKTTNTTKRRKTNTKKKKNKSFYLSLFFFFFFFFYQKLFNLPNKPCCVSFTRCSNCS